MCYPNAKDPNRSNGIKMQQKFLFSNFTSMGNWVDLIFSEVLIALNPFDGQFGQFGLGWRH